MKELFLDVYTEKYYPWFDDYSPKIKNGPYGKYYVLKIDSKNKRKVNRLLKKNHLKSRIYEIRWERSNNYRTNFFKYNNPPYKCRYCRKWLNKKNMEVDHIVPINKVKKGNYARLLLKIHGMNNVNDAKNLAPSCKKCNKRKSDKLGLWYLKGLYGNYKLFWFFYYLFIMMFVISIIYILYSNFLNFNFIK